jgi:uncharacterized damage-inducible protein DinB
MELIGQLQRLAGNNAWSNLRLHRACAALEVKEYEAERTSFFPSIPSTRNHILIVDWYYLDGLEEGGRGRACFADENPFRELAPLAAAQREADMRLLRFTNELTPAKLVSKVQLDRGVRIQVETVNDTLMHLFTHQTHHRGQVHAMLAGTSVKPPPLDEFFMSEELPLREAELRELGLPLR